MPRKVLLTGRAGSGKTRRVLARVAEAMGRGREGECLLLLPTQSQVDHLKGLLLQEGRPAFRDLFAHTFFTFCRSLYRGLPEALLSEEGRDFLISDLLASGRFPSFQRVGEFPGFRKVLGRALRELKDNGIAPGDFSARILTPLGGEGKAAEKHRDLGKILGAYDRLLRERRRLDKEDLFLGALDRLDKEPALLGDRKLLLVDGFHDFTPVEFRILELLASRIPESIFTLSFDVRRAEEPPFLVSAGTRRALLGLGFQEETLSGNRRSADPTLRRLEEGLFSGAAERAEAGDSLRILQAPGREREVESVARSILRLAREEGIPWRDMAVLFHDLSGITDLVEGTFERLGIPVRIYQPRPLNLQPPVRFLLDLGRLLAGTPEAGRILRLLRSGYVAGLPPSEIDHLDAHLREHAAPADWAAWRELALEEDLPGVKRVLKVLAGRRDRTGLRGGASRPGEMWRAAFQEIVFAGESAEEGLLGESGPRGPQECAALQAFWRLVEEAEGRPAGGTEAPSLGSLLPEVEREAGEATFRVRDRRREVVNIIDAREARQWEVPCLFVAGVLERQFPPMPVEDLFFDDEDRRRLNGMGLRFPDRSWRQEEERFLFYTAVTRARERLVLSYPAMDDRGNTTLPSLFFREIERLFSSESLEERTERRSAAAVLPPAGEMASLADVDRAIFAGLEARFPPRLLEGETALAGALYNRRREDPLFRDRLAALLEKRVPRLDLASNLEALNAAEVAFSNSALTSFLQCPYLHFVEKWLRLEPLPERDLDPLDLGNAIHAALKDCFESKGEENPLVLLDRRFGAIAAAKRPTFRRRSDLWRLRRALKEYLAGEITRNRRLGRCPELLERSFGPGRDSPPLSLAVKGRKELLSGTIDRVDLLASGRGAIVVDYKYSDGDAVRRQKKESAGEEITQFQLALYLMALAEALELEPAGAELVALKKRVERAGIGRREVLEKAGLAGELHEEWDLMGEEEFRAFLERARRTMAGLMTRIRSGEIETRPFDTRRCGPGQCPAADICRYDRWVEGEKGEG